MLHKWFSDNLAFCSFTDVVKQVLATLLVCLCVHVCMCICLSNCFMLNIVAKLYEENTLSSSLNNIMFSSFTCLGRWNR